MSNSVQSTGDSSRRKIIEAAIRSLDMQGPDGMTVSHIVNLAGVSRPTFYSYFDDVPGVMAEIWLDRGKEWLRRSASRQPTRESVTSPESRAMVGILAVTPRTPELFEIVVPDVREFESELLDMDPIVSARSVWILATRLGMTASRTVIPNLEVGDLLVALLLAIPDDYAFETGRFDLVPPDEFFWRLPAPADFDAVTAGLVNQSIDVVATSGFAAATLSRIARSAHITTGAVRPRFESVEDLHSRAFEHFIVNVTQENIDRVKVWNETVSPIESYIRLVIGAQSPERTKWRRYRQELHIASWHSGAIAKHLQRADALASEVFGDMLKGLGFDENLRQIAVVGNQTHAVGFSMLTGVGFSITAFDHSPVASYLSELFAPRDKTR